MYFNGANLVSGGSDRSYNQYVQVLSKESEKFSPIDLKGTMTINNGTIIEAQVTNTSNEDINSGKVMAVIFEDLGTSQYHYVVRDILAPVSITTLPPQASEKYSLKSGAVIQNAKTVLYVQLNSGEILQSVLLSPPG
jgi:hypothetical protein